MGIILMLIVGGILGWLASIVMRTDAQQGIFLNIVVGIVGAALGGFLLGGLIGAPPITSGGGLNAGSLLVSFLGAVILLAIVNLFRRERFAKPLWRLTTRNPVRLARAGLLAVGDNQHRIADHG